jgi:hypothetical protein
VSDSHRIRASRRARPGEYPERNENEVEHEQPVPKVSLDLTGPSGPATNAAPARGKSAAIRSAADDFTIFRQTVVTTTTNQASEPTIANDRNGVIATGNTYAFVSGDDGLSFPTNLNPFGNESYGGFCCDQIAYAVDRGGYSLVFWLRQYRYCGDGDSQDMCVGGGALDEDTLKLRVYRGRDDLLDGSDACEWSFQPQEDFKFGRKIWFDFNHISHTPEYLYLTTNVRDESTGSDATSSDGERRDGDIYLTPVQNAGTTM